ERLLFRRLRPGAHLSPARRSARHHRGADERRLGRQCLAPAGGGCASGLRLGAAPPSRGGAQLPDPVPGALVVLLGPARSATAAAAGRRLAPVAEPAAYLAAPREGSSIAPAA